jgi:hypothetical protein
VISLARPHKLAEGALDDLLNREEFHFVVTYTVEELRTYQKIMAGRAYVE